MSDIFQIPSVFIKFESRANKSVKFTFVTQDGIGPDLIGTIRPMVDNDGYLNFAVRQIEVDDLVNLPEIKPTAFPDSKTPAQRQRAVIYLIWKAKGKQGRFDDYYMDTMERIIDQLKQKID